MQGMKTVTLDAHTDWEHTERYEAGWGPCVR